jgi:hypothetical protein
MRIQSQLAVFWLVVLGAGLMLEGCADPAASGPTFEVSFDSSLARSTGGEPTRVELYLVDDCADVPMGARSVDATAETVIVRGGSSGGFGPDLPLGDFGLYGVAQDDDCAIVAAGCTPVTISEDAQRFAITLSRFDAPGCPIDQFCSRQTGECSSGTGGSGGTGGATPSRVTDGLLALYDFDEGSGDTVFDQSEVSPKLDLTIADTGNVTWSPGYLSIEAGTQLESRRDARKLVSAIAPNNAMTMEAWVRPSTLVATGTPPDRIISMSDGSSNRNFLLGQDGTEYTARYRTEGENNGNPTIRSTVGTASLNLAHVVFTHADDGTEVFYINGEEDLTTSRVGTTNTWDPSYPLVVANEVGGGREWLGELHLIAIYDRALDSEEVRQNFDAGP